MNDLVPSALTTDDQEACIRLYYCPSHWPKATGNANTCPYCVRHNIQWRHGMDVFDHPLVHLITDTSLLGEAVCGIRDMPYVSSDQPRRVTCPDCWIVDYTRKHGDPLDNWEPAPLPPKPEPAEPPHDGPHWEHDCEACIYLGTRYGSAREWDLYFHPGGIGNGRPNLLARHGTLGDYVSGMGFIDREPMLAVAAILALRAGHLAASVLRDRRMH